MKLKLKKTFLKLKYTKQIKQKVRTADKQFIFFYFKKPIRIKSEFF